MHWLQSLFAIKQRNTHSRANHKQLSRQCNCTRVIVNTIWHLQMMVHGKPLLYVFVWLTDPDLRPNTVNIVLISLSKKFGAIIASQAHIHVLTPCQLICQIWILCIWQFQTYNTWKLLLLQKAWCKQKADVITYELRSMMFLDISTMNDYKQPVEAFRHLSSSQ